MRLAEARKQQGYTQREFANLIGYHVAYLCRVENSNEPLPPKLRRISAMVLGLDPRVLE